MSDALIIPKWTPLAGGGASLKTAELSDGTVERIGDLALMAMEVTEVNSAEDLAAANAALIQISKFEAEVEQEHKIQKAPFLSAGRAIDAAKNKALETITPHQARLKAICKKYLDAETQRRRQEELRQQAEVERIKREKAKADADAKKSAEEAAQREAQRLVQEAKLAMEKAAAEAKRIADEAEAKEVARLAAEKAENERLEREEQERQIALKVAWDDSVEGKAEAARRREELEAQRLAAEQAAQAEALRLAEEKRLADEAAAAEGERIAAEEARLKSEREAAEAAEKVRMEEAALANAVHQTAIEAVSQPVEKIPTRWVFRLVAKATPYEQSVAMAKICIVRPDLFTITPNKSECNALAKEIQGKAHGFDCFEFIEEAIVRTK